MYSPKDVEFKIIETNEGYFISSIDFLKGYTVWQYLLYFNEKEIDVVTTFDHHWKKIDKLPNKAMLPGERREINKRFELIDQELESKKIPKVIPYIKSDDWEDDGFPIKYDMYRSLYKYVSDFKDDPPVAINATFNVICKVDKIKEYQRDDDTFKMEGIQLFEKSDVKYPILSKVVFPEIILPKSKCCLTSEQMYIIVRNYIKNNIDSKYAYISSDYAFCFTVQKKIILQEPLKRKVELFTKKGERYKVPRYKELVGKYHKLEVFNMTHAGSNYQGYDVIPPFYGKNIEDLTEKLKKYLVDLMEKINRPTELCPNCGGTGIIEDGDYKHIDSF